MAASAIEQKIDDLILSFNDFKEEYGRGRDRHIQEHDRIEKEIYGKNGDDDGLKTKVKFNTSFRKTTKKILIGFFMMVAANIIGLFFLFAR